LLILCADCATSLLLPERLAGQDIPTCESEGTIRLTVECMECHKEFTVIWKIAESYEQSREPTRRVSSG